MKSSEGVRVEGGESWWGGVGKGVVRVCTLFFFNDTATTEIYTLSLHDALPIWVRFLTMLLFPTFYSLLWAGILELTCFFYCMSKIKQYL